MSKILVVIGATGQQGSSVVTHVLNDPVLSQEYKIRAVVHNPTSPKAQDLRDKGLEVVQGDMYSRDSVAVVLKGAYAVFSMTVFGMDPATESQYVTAVRTADVAVEAGVSLLIFSTLTPVSDVSGGKYTRAEPFDDKARAETYIRGLPIRSAFVAGASFMQNLQVQAFLAPYRAVDKVDGKTKWIMTRNNSPKAKLPLIDAVADIGKFVGVVLAAPDKYVGKVLHAAEGFYSLEEIAAALAKSTGEDIVYRQVSDEEFRKQMPFTGIVADIFVEGFHFMEEFGYFGPAGEETVAWAQEQVPQKLVSLDEFLQANPFRLEDDGESSIWKK
jgi:uncharacterized protein YbjT (DUF2867 family)